MHIHNVRELTPEERGTELPIKANAVSSGMQRILLKDPQEHGIPCLLMRAAKLLGENPHLHAQQINIVRLHGTGDALELFVWDELAEKEKTEFFIDNHGKHLGQAQEA